MNQDSYYTADASMMQQGQAVAAPADYGKFKVIIHGTIECAECVDADVLIARGNIVFGKDWALEHKHNERHSATEVTSQSSDPLPGSRPLFTFNTPFEAVLMSSSVYGWPQLGVSLNTIDSSGKLKPIAYTRTHVPMQNGYSGSLQLPLMQPVYTTPQHKLFGFFSGVTAQLRDPDFLCSEEDRLILTTSTVPGYVKVRFNVVVQGLQTLEYD